MLERDSLRLRATTPLDAILPVYPSAVRSVCMFSLVNIHVTGEGGRHDGEAKFKAAHVNVPNVKRKSPCAN